MEGILQGKMFIVHVMMFFETKRLYHDNEDKAHALIMFQYSS